MYKKISGAVVLFCSLTLTQACFADDWGCGEGIRTMIQSINLEASQKDKIIPIVDKLKMTIKENEDQLHSLDSQIDQEVKSDHMNQTHMNELVDKKGMIIGTMIKAKLTMKNQIFMILNPQQKAELQNKMQKLEEKIAARYKSCHDND